VRFRATFKFLSLLWEFWPDDLVIPYFSSGAASENFGERIEYVVTVFVFTCISLIYPYFHARNKEIERQESEMERELLIAKLQDSLAEIKTLRGIIPICAGCKKIRDDKDVWTQLEVYLDQHSDATFSHGLCPDCFTMQMSMLERRGDHDIE
jgi:hypothetical protein